MYHHTPYSVLCTDTTTSFSYSTCMFNSGSDTGPRHGAQDTFGMHESASDSAGALLSSEC